MSKNVALCVLFAYCLALVYVHHVYVGRNGGRLPGHIHTFHQSMPSPAVEANPKIPAGETWYVRPDAPGQTNVYAVGPLDERGKIQVRYFFARDAQLENYTDDDGTPRWRVKR